MIIDLALAILASIQPQDATAAVEQPRLCWITAVRKAGQGVRVHFLKTGGPNTVDYRGTIWRPADQPEESPSVVAELGEILRPQNSHHDLCTVTVLRRDGVIGVEARARLHLPGLPLDERVEFVSATTEDAR
jgi:hypothetical protein